MNVYEIITNRIVEQIEEAKKTGKRFRWVKSWTGGPSAPVSYTTGKEYRGINRLILRPGEYITFKGLMDNWCQSGCVYYIGKVQERK